MIEITIYEPTFKSTAGPNPNGKIRVEFVLPKRPTAFWVSYQVGDRVDFPKGYGVAYIDPDYRRFLMAYIPLNIIISAVMWLRSFTKWSLSEAVYRLEKAVSKNQRK